MIYTVILKNCNCFDSLFVIQLENKLSSKYSSRVSILVVGKFFNEAVNPITFTRYYSSTVRFKTFMKGTWQTKGLWCHLKETPKHYIPAYRECSHLLYFVR